MALPQQSMIMTEDEYLSFERASEQKHEFVAGEVHAMTGASWTHNVICANLSGALNQQLTPSPCVVVANDMLVHISTAEAYRYPDVVVVFGEPEFVDARTDIIVNPIVLIEVLSPSTALVDRNEKLHEYRQLSSLQAYLLVAQESPRVERYLRQDETNWLYTEFNGLKATCNLDVIGCNLSLNVLYRKVKFGES